jgi:hypothetical protein
VPLFHVTSDLGLVALERLECALGVEHESMSNKVDRREVWLEMVAAELCYVAVGRKLEELP